MGKHLKDYQLDYYDEDIPQRTKIKKRKNISDDNSLKPKKKFKQWKND